MPEIVPLIEAYYQKPENWVGGSLHVVLDDYNLDDDCIKHCRDLAAERGDADGVALSTALLQMTPTQRRVAAARADKYGLGAR